MHKEDFYNNIIGEENEEMNFREQVNRYLTHWRWFLLSLFICLILTLIYLYYVPQKYEATTTILVRDEKKGGMLSELSAFADLGLGVSMKNNVDNEIEILKSRSLIESTIQKMNLNVSLFTEGNIIDKDIYANAPVKISFVSKKALFNDANVVLKCHFLGNNTFQLDNIKNDKNKITNLILSSKKEFKYSEPIPTTLGTLIVTKTIDYPENQVEKDKSSVLIVIKPLDNLTEEFKKNLKVESISKTSSVVAISISDPVVKRAEDFLNTMIQIYNADAAEDKNFISENTSKFISNRLALITQELEGVEQNVERFKKSNKLTDIESEAKIFIEGSNEYDKKGVETEIQQNIVSSLLDFLKKSNNSDLLPSNLIPDNAGTLTLINSYNQLILDRNRILKSATIENPSVVKLDQQLISLKKNVETSLDRMLSTL
ncbi:MAG TPA: Wzz/FepE/Etk N-terminal domain-containing protein, partial [Flavobacterium sp.]|nr:Wzz/FepE/Etk N-terminal domain-containing protein [Flavobacterium sp.]